MEIDLEAIRKRDGDWRDDASNKERNVACRDRRALLDYIDELQAIVEEIAVDVGIIRDLHREMLVHNVTPDHVEDLR